MFLMLNGIDTGINMKYAKVNKINDIKNPKTFFRYKNLFTSFKINEKSFLIKINDKPIK